MGLGRGGQLDRAVTGAPYSAIEVTQTSQTLPNGNVISRTTQTTVYRDSQGRVRMETTLPARSGGQTSRTVVSIHDPVAGVSLELDAQTKTAREMKIPGGGGARGAFAGRGARQDATTRPNGRGAGADPNLLRETLPEQAINGVMASGVRETRTTPAGQIGNAQALQTVRETWISTDLKVPVLTKLSDPRTGTTTTQLTNVVRSEPDPSLFQAPADYKVVHGGRGPGGGMGAWGGGPSNR
jgi:hypothetical protein